MSAIRASAPISGARADRQVDRPQAVRTAVDEVAEKEEDAPFPSPRLERRLVEQGPEQVGPAVKVADGEDFRVRRDRARQDKGLSIDDGRHGSSLLRARREHCTARRSGALDCFRCS